MSPNQRQFLLCFNLKQSKILLVTLIVILLFIYILVTSVNSNSGYELLININNINKLQFNNNETTKVNNNSSSSFEKIILVWTDFFGDQSWHNAMEQRLPCQGFITRKRKYLSQASVVLFHWRDFRANDCPKSKVKGQRWIWFNMESPHHTTKMNFLRQFESQFDCWASYRLDSDFVTSYGWFEASNETAPLSQVRLTGKTKQVAWMVSNCNTPSGRDEYVKELSKYIGVDIYGDCGPLKCSKKLNLNCLKMIESKYKFYLSFENSICRDYLTEKVINALNYNIIPIVLGGANYDKLLPSKSYINALDFDSPKELASFLISLGGDEEEYNSYFDWKQRYKPSKIKSFNYIFCEMLNSVTLNKSCQGTGKSLVDWWFNHGDCKSWHPNNSLINYEMKDFEKRPS